MLMHVRIKTKKNILAKNSLDEYQNKLPSKYSKPLEDAETDIWNAESWVILMRCKIYNFDMMPPSLAARILTNNPIIFAQFSSNLNSGMILLSSTIFTGHFRLHLEALWHNLVAILSRQHEMTVVIRQEAKFSFMPEILAANIVVGSSAQGKNCCLGWVG